MNRRSTHRWLRRHCKHRWHNRSDRRIENLCPAKAIKAARTIRTIRAYFIEARG